MKYTNEVVISLLLQKVIKLFDNPVNFSKGHPGFISIELLSDTTGQKGAKSRLRYRIRKGRLNS